MVEKLSIPIRYAPELKRWDGLLITMDCGYGNNNVQFVEASEVAIIDHHPASSKSRIEPSLCEIRPALGSCATLVWHLLERADYRPVGLKPQPVLPREDRDRLAIALYYGLYMDTSGLAELRHPLDRELLDALSAHGREKLIQEEALLKLLLNSRLSRSDLETTQKALGNITIDETNRLALIPVSGCDLNLLGYISDLAIQVAGLDLVVAWTSYHQGLKFSVRSSVRETQARDLALWLVRDGEGDGGGHAEKAGGCLRKVTLKKAKKYFQQEIMSYIQKYAVIDCAKDAIGRHRRGMGEYQHKETVCGYVPTASLSDTGARLGLRMLETINRGFISHHPFIHSKSILQNLI